MKCFILCGGSGSRLWPYSTENKPKQFLKIIDDKTLLQNTYERAKKISTDISIITSKSFLSYIQEQLSEEKYNILLEPCRRDTAAAITVSISECNDNDIILVLPSDHYISTDDQFIKNVEQGLKYIDENIVTFGILPKYAETGYGYIESYENNVTRFIEKPNIEKVEYFLKNKNFYWNSGIYLFKTNIFKQEMKKYNESFYIECSNSINKGIIDKTLFEKIKNISIDIALMEKTNKIKMIKSDFIWSDVGTWKSISLLNNKKEENVIEIDNVNCLIKSDADINKKKKIVCIGLKNMCVIETNDNLLIMDLESSGKLKNINI